jgi:hypothetical protein
MPDFEYALDEAFRLMSCEDIDLIMSAPEVEIDLTDDLREGIAGQTCQCAVCIRFERAQECPF